MADTEIVVEKQMIEVLRAESHSYEPRGLAEAKELAKLLSASGLLSDSLRGKPHDVLTIMIASKELGLATMQGLRSINVIKGKAVMSADLTVGLVLSHRDLCEYFQLVDSDSKRATYETKRTGSPKPTSLSYTIEEAAAAQLLGKDNWKHYPTAMLRARCSAALARAVYPDLCAGIYDPDEIGAVKAPVGAVTEQRQSPTALSDTIAAAAESMAEPAQKVVITDVTE